RQPHTKACVAHAAALSYARRNSRNKSTQHFSREYKAARSCTLSRRKRFVFTKRFSRNSANINGKSSPTQKRSQPDSPSTVIALFPAVPPITSCLSIF